MNIIHFYHPKKNLDCCSSRAQMHFFSCLVVMRWGVRDNPTLWWTYRYVIREIQLVFFLASVIECCKYCVSLSFVLSLSCWRCLCFAVDIRLCRYAFKKALMEFFFHSIVVFRIKCESSSHVDSKSARKRISFMIFSTLSFSTTT